MNRVFLWDNRTLCDIFDEIRTCTKTHNYSYLPGLLEEAQVLANRMEAGLGDIKDIRKISARKRELKAEIRKLERKAKSLGLVEEDND